MKTFASRLAPLVSHLGSSRSAELCGVTKRCINRWLDNTGNPNLATQAGALLILSKAARKAPKRS